MHLDEFFRIKGKNLWDLGDFINGAGGQRTLEGLDPTKTYTIIVKASPDFTTTSTAWSVSPRNANGISRGNIFYMNDYIASQSVSASFNGAYMLRISTTAFEGSLYICLLEGTATEYVPYIGEFKTIGNIWERGVNTESVKGASTQFKNTRKCANLFDEANIGYFPTTSPDYGVITFTNGKLNYKHTPTISGGRNSIGSNSFYLDAGTYTVSYSGKGDLSVSLVQETSFGSHTGGVDVAVNAGTFTANERKSYHFGLNLVANKTYDEEFNIMLVKGSTAQPYYPHFSPSTVLPSLKAFGATPVKHKAPKLWGQYVPAVASDTTTYPMVDTNGAKFVKDIGLDGTGTDFGYLNEATGEYVKAAGASGTVIQPISYVGLSGNASAVTGVDALETDRVIIDANIDATQGSGDRYITYTTDTWIDVANGGSTWYTRFGSTVSASTSISNNDIGQRNTYEIYKGHFDINGAIKTAPIYSEIGGKWIVGAKNSSENCADGEYYRYTIKNNTTSEIRYDAIPVRIGTTVELLDLVNWQFATRTGTFTAGADIPYSQFCPDIITVNTGDLAYGQWGKNLCPPTTMTNVGWAVSVPSLVKVFNNLDVGTYTISLDVTITQRNDINDGSTCGIYVATDVGLNTFSLGTAGVGDTVRAQAPAIITESNKGTFTVVYVYGCGKSGVGVTGRADITNMQIELGSTATPYEPYHFGIHTDGSHKLYIGSQGVVDLGTLSWTKQNFGSTYVFNVPSSELSDIKMVVDVGRVSNGFVEGYNIVSYSQLTSTDRSISMLDWQGTKNMRVYDTRYTTAAEFKAAMSGKYLFYQRTDDTEFIPPVSRDIPILLSADSFVDAQLAANNKSEAWGVKVLDGTESWVSTSYDYGVAIQGSTFNANTSTAAIRAMWLCSHLPVVDGEDGENRLTLQGSNYNVRLNLNSTIIPGTTSSAKVALAKAWLASEYAKGTPVIILYPLATPAVSTHAIDKVALTEKAQYTVTAEAELPVTEQATYLGVG